MPHSNRSKNRFGTSAKAFSKTPDWKIGDAILRSLNLHPEGIPLCKLYKVASAESGLSISDDKAMSLLAKLVDTRFAVLKGAVAFPASKTIKSVPVTDLNIVEKPAVVSGLLASDCGTRETVKRLALRLISSGAREEFDLALEKQTWGDIGRALSNWAARLLCGHVPQYKAPDSLMEEWTALSTQERYALGAKYSQWATEIRFADEVFTASRSAYHDAHLEERTDLSEEHKRLLRPQEWQWSHYAKSHN